jgi:hypothetical protein
MSGLAEVIGGMAAGTQIVGQIIQVVRLLIEIQANMNNGPGSVQEQDRRIQQCINLVMMIKKNHSGDPLAMSLTDASLQDAELLHKELHGISIDAADGVIDRFRKSVKRKAKERDILKLESRLQLAMAMINAYEGTNMNALLNDIYDIMVRKQKVGLISLG